MLPERSRGGAALAVEPWHDEQFTPKSPLPAFEWHLLQVTAEAVAGGVRAWHFVQAAVPVAAAAPWKLALLRSSQPDGWPAKPSPTPFTWRPPPASIEPSDLTVSGWQALQVARVNPAAEFRVVRGRNAVAGAAGGLGSVHRRPAGREVGAAEERGAVAVDVAAGGGRAVPGRRCTARGGDPSPGDLDGPVHVAGRRELVRQRVAGDAGDGRGEGAGRHVGGVRPDRDLRRRGSPLGVLGRRSRAVARPAVAGGAGGRNGALPSLGGGGACLAASRRRRPPGRRTPQGRERDSS